MCFFYNCLHVKQFCFNFSFYIISKQKGNELIMRIFTPNIKLVKELNRYISLSDIEKARFKKFNSPKIDDGNVLCDEFFRTEELFSRKTDWIRSIQSYGIDDLPVYTRSRIVSNDIQRVSASKAANVETDLPYYVDILGENKRIYVEKYGTKNPKHPHVEMYDTSNIWNNKNLYENRTVDEVVNIRYFADNFSAANNRALEYEALALLKKDYPLEYVIYLMKQSVLKSPNGHNQASTGLLKFLADYPDMRRYVVTHNDFKEEVFDSCAAKAFPKLLDICNDDLKTVNQILWDCKIPKFENAYLVEQNLLETGISLYKIDNVWNKQKSEIIEELSKNQRKVIEDFKKEIENLINSKNSLSDIHKKIVQYNKNHGK